MISAGCLHCYAATQSQRFGWTSLPWTEANAAANVKLWPDRLDIPLRWQRGRNIFVNSTSDLFHSQVPDAYIDQVFAVMALSQRHTFSVLTKRPARMLEYLTGYDREHRIGQAAFPIAEAARLDWDWFWRKFTTAHGVERWPLPNVRIGVTVENQKAADERMPILLETPAAGRFISSEPLLGPVDLSAWLVREREATDPDLDAPDGAIVEGMERSRHYWRRIVGVDQLIVGGESGAGARPMQLEWARDLARQATDTETPFFFKQLGLVLAGELGIRGKGAVVSEWPADLQRQDPPAVPIRRAIDVATES